MNVAARDVDASALEPPSANHLGAESGRGSVREIDDVS
jgi:hypothetical protein